MSSYAEKLENKIKKLEADLKAANKNADKVRASATKVIRALNKIEDQQMDKLHADFVRAEDKIVRNAKKVRGAQESRVDRADNATVKISNKIIDATNALARHRADLAAGEVSMPVPHDGGVAR